jgi:methionyl-tRNA formyltransferase
MTLDNFGCLLINNARSKSYIQALSKKSFLPSFVIFLDIEGKKTEGVLKSGTTEAEIVRQSFNNRQYFFYDTQRRESAVPTDYKKPEKYLFFDPEKDVVEFLEENGVNHRVIQCKSINDDNVVDAISKAKPVFFLFGGGGILRKAMFNTGKRFIHIHPGEIPYFRGSQCIEWSILYGKPCVATAFFMTEKIDDGEVILQKEYANPELENNNIASLYSSYIRTDTMLDAIERFVIDGKFQQSNLGSDGPGTFYKMHPVLTNLVFNKLEKP